MFTWTEPSIDVSHSTTDPRISNRDTKTMSLMMNKPCIFIFLNKMFLGQFSIKIYCVLITEITVLSARNVEDSMGGVHQCIVATL